MVLDNETQLPDDRLHGSSSRGILTKGIEDADSVRLIVEHDIGEELAQRRAIPVARVSSV